MRNKSGNSVLVGGLRRHITLLGAVCGLCLLTFALAGCSDNKAGSGQITPESFRADPSKMTPEDKKRMEEAMKGANPSGPNQTGQTTGK